MTPCQNCSSSELEFGMRPQAIWMFYNHSVLKLNLSFLRLIVKRTKKVDFRFRLKFIEWQSRENRRPTEEELKIDFVAWRRKKKNLKTQREIRKRSKREKKMKKWMTVSNYWIIVDIVEIVFYYLLIYPALYRL